MGERNRSGSERGKEFICFVETIIIYICYIVNMFNFILTSSRPSIEESEYSNSISTYIGVFVIREDLSSCSQYEYELSGSKIHAQVYMNCVPQ